MIRVLIAEDERRTARYLGQLVSQHSDCIVVKIVSNGADALAFLEKQPVDLVITDIRMPVMDGIALLQHIHETLPHCFSIVLSGYSEFEYAKAALQYQAYAYLLKPIDQTELFQILDKVRQVLTEQAKTQRRFLCQRAMNGSLLPEEDGEQVYLAVIRVGQTLSAGRQSFWNLPEQTAVLWQHFGDNCHSFYGEISAERVLLIDASEAVPGQLHRCYDAIENAAQAPVRCVCTCKPLALWAVSSAVPRLRSALWQKCQIFRSDFFSVDPAEPQSVPKGPSLRDLHLEQAVEAVCTQDRAQLIQYLQQLLCALENRNLSLADVQSCLDTVVNDARLSYQMSPAKLSQVKTVLAETIGNALDPAICIQQLTDQLLTLQSKPSGQQEENDAIEEIVQLLNASYHMPITTKALAKQYGFLPRHLNKIFKQQVGMRPMEYLLSLRMKQARFMLESVPDAQVKDVASSVGYNDPLYFSKLFKRENGLWPSEYQNSRKES